MRSFHVGVIAPLTLPEPLNSARAVNSVCRALEHRGYNVSALAISNNLESEIRRMGIDIGFIAAEWPGREGALCGMLQTMGIPHTGSGVLASAVAGDKVRTKETLRLNNLPTTPYYVIYKDSSIAYEAIQHSFGFPVMIKPARGTHSLGVSMAGDHEALKQSIFAAETYYPDVLVERCVKGTEIVVGILDGRILGAAEVSGQGHDVSIEFPARLRPTLYRGILNLALRAACVLNVKGAVTVDMLLCEQENEYILEVNAPPDLSEDGLMATIASGAGLGYEDLVERVLFTAEARTGEAYADGIPDKRTPAVERDPDSAEEGHDPVIQE